MPLLIGFGILVEMDGEAVAGEEKGEEEKPAEKILPAGEHNMSRVGAQNSLARSGLGI